MEIAEINVIKVDGSAGFTVRGTKFIISPLPQETSIYIDGFTANSTDSKLLGTTKPNDYTTVGRIVCGSRFHLDTSANFYVKWD